MKRSYPRGPRRGTFAGPSTRYSVQRLRDAQAHLPVDRAEAYVRPGILWRALDPSGAGAYDREPQPAPREGAVVLLDEIDKADPDTPNDLLVPLGSGTFQVTDLGTDITLQRALQPLVLITTNNERELPRAFMRRCVVLRLPEPAKEWLTVVASAHYGPSEKALYDQVAGYVIAARKRAEAEGARPPSTAEFLDALQACRELGIRPGTEAWNKVALTTLTKWLPQQAPS
jgi:MoxR-like ATPase